MYCGISLLSPSPVQDARCLCLIFFFICIFLSLSRLLVLSSACIFVCLCFRLLVPLVCLCLRLLVSLWGGRISQVSLLSPSNHGRSPTFEKLQVCDGLPPSLAILGNAWRCLAMLADPPQEDSDGQSCPGLPPFFWEENSSRRSRRETSLQERQSPGESSPVVLSLSTCCCCSCFT